MEHLRNRHETNGFLANRGENYKITPCIRRLPAAHTLATNTHTIMSIDKSLKRKGGMSRPRCVLKRSERILKMLENGTFKDDMSPFGLPKTRVQKIVIKKKAKVEKVEGAEGATPAAGAAAAKPAGGGKK